MSFINNLKRFATTTVGLMAIGIGSTVLIYTTHRLVIKRFIEILTYKLKNVHFIDPMENLIMIH